MENIRFYGISRDYVDYLSPAAPNLFHNSQSGQTNERKYIGIILCVNGRGYFAPLSSFKPKHASMNEALDFIAEYRFIKSIQGKIRKNAATLYKHKLEKGSLTPLARRCNDFAVLETMCAAYQPK